MNEVIHTICRDLRLTSTSLIGVDCLPTKNSLEFISSLEKHLINSGFNVSIIDVEDFHNPTHFYRFEEHFQQAYCQNAYDYATLVNEIVAPLISGRSINKQIPLLDRHLETYSYHKNFSINTPSIVIVYGFNIYKRPLNMYFHKRLFITYDTSSSIHIDVHHGLYHYFDNSSKLTDVWEWYSGNTNQDLTYDYVLQEDFDGLKRAK